MMSHAWCYFLAPSVSVSVLQQARDALEKLPQEPSSLGKETRKHLPAYLLHQAAHTDKVHQLQR